MLSGNDTLARAVPMRKVSARLIGTGNPNGAPYSQVITLEETHQSHIGSGQAQRKPNEPVETKLWLITEILIFQIVRTMLTTEQALIM